VIDQSLLSKGSGSSGLQNESTGIRPVGDQDIPIDSPQIQSEPDPRVLRPPVIQGLHQLVQQSAASFQEESFQAGSSITVLENIRDCTKGSDEQAGLGHVGKQTLASDPPGDCHSQSGAELLVGQESISIHETGDHSECLPSQSGTGTELLGRHPVANLKASDLAGGLNQSDVESLAHQLADVQEESELSEELNPPPLQSKLPVGQETKANSGDLPGFELKDGSDRRANRKPVRGNESSSDLVSGVSKTQSGLDLLGLKSAGDKESSVRQSGDNIDEQQSTDVRDANILLEEKDIRSELQPGDAQKAAAIYETSLSGGMVQSESQPSAVSKDDSVLLDNMIGRPELNPKVLQLKEQHKACVLSLGPCVKSGMHRGALLALPVQSEHSSLSKRVEENEGCDLVDPEPEEAIVAISGRSVDMSQFDSREPVKLHVEPPPPKAQGTAEFDLRDKLPAQIESVLSVSPGKLDQMSEDQNCTNVEVWYRQFLPFFT
jgi:hypothetical protein